MKLRDALERPLLAAALMWVGVAHATLGGAITSVYDDAAALHGVVSVRPDGAVSVMELCVDNGIVVRELLDAAGMVIAVTWSGPAPPDLSQLLGSYDQPFTAALAALATPGRQRAVHIQTADLVVDLAGHLRAYSGRAYLPRRMPPGMAASAIR